MKILLAAIAIVLLCFVACVEKDVVAEVSMMLYDSDATGLIGWLKSEEEDMKIFILLIFLSRADQEIVFPNSQGFILPDEIKIVYTIEEAALYVASCQSFQTLRSFGYDVTAELYEVDLEKLTIKKVPVPKVKIEK